MRRTSGRLLALFILAAGLTIATTVGLGAFAQDEPAKPAPPPDKVPMPAAPLLKENSRLIDVEGLILDLKDDLKIGEVNRPVFQPKDGLGYLILLENTLLEKVIGETAHGERPVKVRGTVTLFREKNYLLLDAAAVKRE
jgi:hypothetical protein